MIANAFSKLTRYRPRTFVSENSILGEWTVIRPYFQQLEDSSAQLITLDDLEEWILQGSELSAALDEESSRRYIAMTCNTDDSEAEKAYLHFVENIEPET